MCVCVCGVVFVVFVCVSVVFGVSGVVFVVFVCVWCVCVVWFLLCLCVLVWCVRVC